MNILVMGNYDPDYNRTKIILSGLQVQQQHTYTNFPIGKHQKVSDQLLKHHIHEADLIYLPPFTHHQVIKYRKYFTKPVLFDPLVSRYLTKVFDYKNVWRYSPSAFINFYRDKFSMKIADRVIADTQAHANYFTQVFGIPSHKISVLPIGFISKDFENLPITPRSQKFRVGFYGGFIPLQGTLQIIEAINLLKQHNDIEFELIGNGFEFPKALALALKKYQLQNVVFKGWVPYQQLPAAIQTYDLTLGIFGNTPKADLVIPNKIYHYAAAGKCILTAKNKAITEVFTHNHNIILTSTKPADIANSILEIKKDVSRLNRIGENAGNLMQMHYNEHDISLKFLEIAALCINSPMRQKIF